MKSAARLVAALVVVSLALGGPLAWLAGAQTPTPQAPASQPAPQPASPLMQPELFPETLKTPRDGERGDIVYEAGAVFVNVFRVPGKVFLCGLGAGVSAVVLAITFGNSYKAAAAVLNEGCGGQWIVGPDDLRPDKASSTYREATATN